MIHEAVALGRDRKLRAVDRLVLVLLAHRSMTAASNLVKETLATLAADTGLSRRGLIGSLHRLRDAGAISIERHGRANNYRLCVRELLREKHQHSAGYAPISRRPVRRVHHSRPSGAYDAPVPRGRPHLVVVNGTHCTET